jgi:hypothetical protein
LNSPPVGHRSECSHLGHFSRTREEDDNALRRSATHFQISRILDEAHSAPSCSGLGHPPLGASPPSPAWMLEPRRLAAPHSEQCLARPLHSRRDDMPTRSVPQLSLLNDPTYGVNSRAAGMPPWPLAHATAADVQRHGQLIAIRCDWPGEQIHESSTQGGSLALRRENA